MAKEISREAPAGGVVSVCQDQTTALKMIRLMHGFPPSTDRQVTLANWRQAPFSRWAFHHVRELVPSAEIANDPADVHEWRIDHVEIGNIPIEADGARPLSFDEFLAETSTDGIVIARGGRIVFERYANGMTEVTPHILMSVSKSLLGWSPAYWPRAVNWSLTAR